MLSMMLLILPYAIEIPLARVICSDSASEKFSIDFNGVAVVIPTLQDAIKNVDDSSFLYSRLITTSSTASQRKQSFSMNDLPRLYFVLNIFSKSSLSSTASNSLNSTPSIFESRIFIWSKGIFCTHAATASLIASVLESCSDSARDSSFSLLIASSSTKSMSAYSIEISVAISLSEQNSSFASYKEAVSSFIHSSTIGPIESELSSLLSSARGI